MGKFCNGVKLTWLTRSATRTKHSTDTSALVNAWKLVLLTVILTEWTCHTERADCETCHVIAKPLLSVKFHVTFSLFPENNLIVSRESIEYIDVTGRPRGLLSRGRDTTGNVNYNRAWIVKSWISWILVTRKLDASRSRELEANVILAQ